MPVSGRKPKPAGQAVHRNKPTHDWTEVVDVPFDGAPKVPGARPDGQSWPAWTLRWWAAVCAMPHCTLWSASDWQFATETALLVAEFHEGNSRLATEIRNREKVLGTTWDYRRDLRIRYIAAPVVTDEDAIVTSIASYRDL